MMTFHATSVLAVLFLLNAEGVVHPKTQQVESTLSIIEAPALAGSGGQDGKVSGVIVRGVLAKNLGGFKIAAGSVRGAALDDFCAGRGVVIGKYLANELSLATGDTLVIVTPTGGTSLMGAVPLVKRYRVLAIHDNEISVDDQVLVYLQMAEVRKFFDSGDDQNGFSDPDCAKDIRSMEKFHNAVHSGDLEIVRTMLAADPALATSVDKARFQPIHLLDMYFDAEILDLLLANGADINARNDEGITLLHIITEPDAVPLLVKRGADIEARDNKGWTPLMRQTGNQQNGPDVVAALLAVGANPHAKGNNGETALTIAQQSGNAEFIDMLMHAGK